MRYWYDTEFLDTGSTIDLVSIGMVAEDGRELYLQSCEFEHSKANDWVKEHVFPHLAICPHITHDSNYDLLWQQTVDHVCLGQCTFTDPEKGIIGAYTDCFWRTREQIKNEVLAFVNAGVGKPEFIGYYSGYDHVALAQLFGPMINLPKGWPMYTIDLKQTCDELGNPRLPVQGKSEHNALQDARWNKLAWEFLQEYREIHGYRIFE
jgi:hypothetical protein